MCLVAGGIGVLFGHLHIAERVDHFGRRVGLLDFDAEHADPRTIGVERALHAFAHIQLDRGTALAGERLVEIGFGDGGTHRSLGNLVHGFDRFDQTEFVIRQILDVPAHDIAQVDEVLVAGENQPDLLVVARNTQGPNPLHILDVDRFDREGG